MVLTIQYWQTKCFLQLSDSIDLMFRRGSTFLKPVYPNSQGSNWQQSHRVQQFDVISQKTASLLVILHLYFLSVHQWVTNQL